jgi:hypothetical protein
MLVSGVELGSLELPSVVAWDLEHALRLAACSVRASPSPPQRTERDSNLAAALHVA